MSVDIGRAIEEGGKRTIAKNGLYLVAIAWVLGVLSTLFGNSAARGMMEQLRQFQGSNAPPGMPFGPDAMGPTLGLSPGVAWLLSIAVSLLGIVVVGAAFRTFVTEDTETLPAERFTRRVGWMWINLLVGWIVFWIAVSIGLVLLVVPGLFLLVSLLFFGVYVAAEDQNFIEGFQNSWALTRGNRLMLFLTGVVVVIVAIVVSWLFGLPQFALGGTIGLLISQVGSAFALVFMLATIARTYEQLEAAEPAAAAE